jgi:hypothetical protein
LRLVVVPIGHGSNRCPNPREGREASNVFIK